MASTTVLDSHALLACFRGEPGGERVRDLMRKAAASDRPLLMSEVNYAEVKYTILRKEGVAGWNLTAEALQSLPIAFVPADRRLADLAADFKARFKLSLADAFAAALAKEKKADLVTGDPEFKALVKEIRVQWLSTD